MLQAGHVFPGKKYMTKVRATTKVKCMQSSVRVHGLSGGSRNQNSSADDTSGFYKPSTTTTMKGRRTKVAKRRQLCVLQGEHARNVQGSRNHKSKNDDCYAFYKEHKHATVRCRGITSPKTTTVLRFATTTNMKSQANQIEKSQANPGRSHKRTLYLLGF